MQEQKGQPEKNRRLKLQIDKISSLIETSTLKQLTSDMAVGLLSFTAVLDQSYDYLIKMSATLNKKVQLLFSLAQQKAITRQNISQLIAYVKYKAIQNKKAFSDSGFDYVLNLLDQVLSQLVLDNNYVKDYYLQSKYAKEKNPNRISKLKSGILQSSNLGIDCQMCLLDIQHSNVSLLSCGHSFHRSCFRKYAEFKILDKSFPILCPFQQCKNIVPTKDIEQQIDGQFLQKYYQFTFQNYVQKNIGDTSWCPSPGCTSVFSYDEELQQYRCPACKKNYCLKCKCQMHFGATCQEYRLMNNLSEHDKAFIEFAKGAKFKQCPKCRFWVQKNEGCDHMTCRCKYQFCYKCGKEYGVCGCQQHDDEESMPDLDLQFYDHGQNQEPQMLHDEPFRYNSEGSEDNDYDGVYVSKIRPPTR